MPGCIIFLKSIYWRIFFKLDTLLQRPFILELLDPHKINNILGEFLSYSSSVFSSLLFFFGLVWFFNLFERVLGRKLLSDDGLLRCLSAVAAASDGSQKLPMWTQGAKDPGLQPLLPWLHISGKLQVKMESGLKLAP